MPELLNTTTLEVRILELERLERRIAELEADLSVVNDVIVRLERIAGLVRTHEERRDREREAHVREELFNYDLSHPGEDE